MQYTNIGPYKTLIQYVNYKYSLLSTNDTSFGMLYRLMFLDEKNIMFEKSEGYKISKFTYREIKDRIEVKAFNIANTLDNKKGKCIAIYLDNDNRFIETYWAILKSGNNPLLLNTRLSDDTLEDALKTMNVELVITNGKTFGRKCIDVDSIEADNGTLDNEVFGEEMYIMSTGTSSKVKICAYRAKELFNVLKESKDIILKNKMIKKHYEGELKLLAFLPFYHIFGFVANYLWFAFYSRTFVLLKDNMPRTIQNTIKRHKVTHIFAVPLLWEKTYQAAIKEIRNRGEKTYNKFLKGMKLASYPIIGKLITKYAFKEVRENIFGESISFLISGGSMISEEVLTFFNSIGYHLANGYGMSEVGITSVELSLDRKLLNKASIGEPLSGINYAINEEGELNIYGNTLAYYIIENGEKKYLEGRYNSHDLAVCKDNHYYLKGRKDDLIISSNGENVNPYEIEKLMNMEGIYETALIYHSSLSNPVLLVGIDRYTSIQKMERIKKDIDSVIKKNNLTTLVGQIVFVNGSLLKENEFKINRNRLLKEYMDHSLSLYDVNKTKEDDNDELLKKIKGLFAIALNKEEEDITSDFDFFLDGGGTSLDFYVISEAINEEYHLSIFKDNEPLSTPQKIYQHLKENL